MAAHRSYSTLHVGRLAGIPIGIQPLWLVIVAFLTYTLGHDYFAVEDRGLSASAAYLLGLLSALGLFAGIVAHELGHAIVARRRGVQVEEIDLWLLGGVSRLHGDAKRPQDEAAFALAGPAVTAALLVVLSALRLTVGEGLPAWGQALLDYQLLVSAMILGFNLLPAFPLDGGRVARALLWMRYGDVTRATLVAARLGRGFGWAIAVIGVAALAGGAPAGVWLMLVGGFLVIAAGAEMHRRQIVQVLGDATVADLMSAPAIEIAAWRSLDVAAEQLGSELVSSLPVVDEMDRVIGIVTIDDVRLVSPDERRATSVGAVARRVPELLVEPATPVATLLELASFGRIGRAVVVDEQGAAVGIVSITDVERRLRAGELAAPAPPIAA